MLKPTVLVKEGAYTIPKDEAGFKTNTRKCTKPRCKRTVVRGRCFEHRRKIRILKPEDMKLLEMSKGGIL